MLKKTLSGILALTMAMSIFTGSALAQTEEKVLFSDNFESGTLDSAVWNVTDLTNLGVVKNEEVKFIQTEAEGTNTFKYPYSSEKTDVAITATINAESWSEAEGSMIKLQVRKLNNGNYFGVEYDTVNGTFEVVRYQGGENNKTSLGKVTKKLDAGIDYTLSLQARHGIIRFELDGVTLIQDYIHQRVLYTGYETHYAEFSTINQALKITALSVNEEDTLIRQKFSNTKGITLTGSNYPAANLKNNYSDENTPAEDYVYLKKTSGNVGFEVNAANWEYISIGDDFSTTETNIVMKTSLGSQETLHIRTGINYGNASMYITKIMPAKFSLGTNYGTANADASGWIAKPNFDDGEYHTYTVRTVAASDYSSVTLTLLIDGVQYGSWTDTTPRYNSSQNLIPAGGASLYVTDFDSDVYVKSFEIKDITGSDALLYEETFANLDYWTGAPEIKSEGNTDNMYYTTTAAQGGTLALDGKEWKNITASTDIKLSTLSSESGAYAGIMARYVDDSNYLLAAYRPADSTVFFSKNGEVVASKAVTAWAAESTHNLSVSVKASDVRIEVDGVPVIMTQFDAGANAIGSVALRSENQATKFDNVKVSGNPYYFFEDFEAEPDWSGYKFNADNVSIIKARDGGVTPTVANGVLTTTNAQLILKNSKTYSSDWDDVMYIARMKTTGNNLNQLHLRAAVDDANANYCVCFDTSSAKLWYNTTYGKNILPEAAKTYSITPNEWFDLKLRVTDVVTSENKKAVRLRLYVDTTEIFDYTDDGSAAAVQMETASASEQNLLKQFPKTADSYSRGFQLDTVDTAPTMTYDYIAVVDPNADTLSASLTSDKASTTANDTVTATLNITNDTYEKAEAMFITALYDNNGELKDVKVTYPQVATGSADSFTQTINVDATATANWNVKMFAWNGWNTMNPLTGSVTVPVQ